jgi:hypothetical protein
VSAPSGDSVTATVTASADSSTETLVKLFNSTNLGQVKICKQLTANSGDMLNGANVFTFDPSYRLAGSAAFVPMAPVTVTVPALTTPECVLDTTLLPLGTEVRVSEAAVPNSSISGITVQPASQAFGTAGSADMIVGPNAGGVTTVTFTDTASGTVEICKNIDDSNFSLPRGGIVEGIRPDHNGDHGTTNGSIYDPTPFSFSVNGGAPITIESGSCSAPISVPAGTATVSEALSTDFHLLSMAATGPDGSSRLTSSPTTNPATVTVPYGGSSNGGVGNETLVTVTNQVDTAQYKICKTLAAGVPVGKSYTFSTTVDFGGVTSPYATGASSDTTLTPTGDGAAGTVCSGLGSAIPVIAPDGTPTTVTTTEGTSPFGYTGDGKDIVEPTSVVYSGNGTAGDSSVYATGDTPAQDGTYYGSATLGEGVNLMTFTNSLVLDP